MVVHLHLDPGIHSLLIQEVLNDFNLSLYSGNMDSLKSTLHNNYNNITEIVDLGNNATNILAGSGNEI